MATVNAGKALIAAASSWLRAAVEANTALELRISPWSWAGDLASAPKTLPPSLSSALVAASSRLSTLSTASTLVANGYSWAIAALNC